MGLAIDTIAGRIGANVTSPTAVTMATGDSNAVRSFPFEAGAFLYQTWARTPADGTMRIRSPRMHDFVQGIRLRFNANDSRALLPERFAQRLFPQDELTLELAGTGAAETGVGVWLIYYRDLPGISAQLRTWEEIAPRIEDYVGQETSITTSATAGEWGPGDRLIADFDNLKANREYAVLGYTVDTPVAAVALRGSDTGNLRVGGPGEVDSIQTRDFFVRLSVEHGTPAIPVFNSANREAILVDAVTNAASVAVNITWVMALLSV